MAVVFGRRNFCVTHLTIFSLFFVNFCHAYVKIEDKDGGDIAIFDSAQASFGMELPKKGLLGWAVKIIPEDGCDPTDFTSPPKHRERVNWIAVMSRSKCNFEKKVRNAAEHNYSAAIVYNDHSDKIFPMGGSDDDKLIPSVFIGYSSGQEILEKYTYEINPDVYLLLTRDDPFDINAYLLPFAIVVGICFLIMLGIVLYKCIQDHRRRRRHRLPKSALKKLPIHKFKNGDPFETCCICLDDFEEGDKLRILPCDHGYHYKCIDPWLLKNKRICPQCRKRVFSRGSGYSGDSDDSDSTTNERSALIRPNNSSSSVGGTFGGPSTSTSATMERLQNAGASLVTQSDPSRPSTSSSFQHWDETSQTAGNMHQAPGRNVLQSNHRRLRRARRLRRIYEALSESSSSDVEEGPIDNTVGEAAGGEDAHSENQSISSDHHPQQHVSAEIHVQVHEDNEEESRNLNFDEDTASMPELEDHIPEVMVTSRSPGSDDSKLKQYIFYTYLNFVGYFKHYICSY